MKKKLWHRFAPKQMTDAFRSLFLLLLVAPSHLAKSDSVCLQIITHHKSESFKQVLKWSPVQVERSDNDALKLEVQFCNDSPSRVNKSTGIKIIVHKELKLGFVKFYCKVLLSLHAST